MGGVTYWLKLVVTSCSSKALHFYCNFQNYKLFPYTFKDNILVDLQ